jgi:hypothetical protein
LRFVFLDEGGISKHEPFAVVAGVIVHGDEQLVPLEREIHKLVLKHIPAEQQDGFVFHATDIWSGTGKIFGDRDRWTFDRRMIVLRDLARIIPNNRLPLKHIRTSIHFADKTESAPLQLADLCAFLIRGRLARRPQHERLNSRLYGRLKSMMVMFASGDENYYGPIITARPPYVAEQLLGEHIQTYRRLRQHLESERS